MRGSVSTAPLAAHAGGFSVLLPCRLTRHCGTVRDWRCWTALRRTLSTACRASSRRRCVLPAGVWRPRLGLGISVPSIRAIPAPSTEALQSPAIQALAPPTPRCMGPRAQGGDVTKRLHAVPLAGGQHAVELRHSGARPGAPAAGCHCGSHVRPHARVPPSGHQQLAVGALLGLAGVTCFPDILSSLRGLPAVGRRLGCWPDK